MSMKQTPTVSVILVNYRGATDTLEALSYLRSVEWARPLQLQSTTHGLRRQTTNQPSVTNVMTEYS
jgi:hypothetical protein